MKSRLNNAIAGIDRMSMLLTPADSFGSERFRGLLMSAISGVLANLLNFVGIKYMGLSVQLSSVLFLQVMGNVMGYILDILFAKKNFIINNFHGSGTNFDGPLPYREIGTRVKWLVNSFLSKQFYRFIITVIIDTLVSLSLLNWSIKAMDSKKILTEFKYRNFMLAALIAVGTFFLYNNILRFDWAYVDHDQPIFNVIILMWVTLVLMMYAVTYTAAPGPTISSNDLTGERTNEVSNKFSPVFSSL